MSKNKLLYDLEKIVSLKLVEAQDLKQKVHCDGAGFKNVLHFKYLGSVFSADGSNEPDVKRRITLSMDAWVPCGMCLTQLFI